MRNASTEPRPRGRGTHELRRAPRRPLRFNGAPTSRSGNVPQRSRYAAAARRFNGAPTSRSGNDRLVLVNERETIGFNGAPTSRSGNVHCETGVCGGRTGFNGAPTSRSGNVRHRLRFGCRAVASTEPRPRGRGTVRGVRARRSGVVLQRSPDLAVGERFAPRSKSKCESKLQRSPDLAVGERGTTCRTRSRSTGFNGAPTSRSGNGRLVAEVRLVEEASTEPRPRGRGTAASSKVNARGLMLQRSPDLAVGERSTWMSTTSCSSGLQRSPDLAVGERCRAWRGCTSSRSFNGAPTSRSGNVARPRPGRPGRPSFNGAPTSRSGNAARPRQDRRRRSCFNGAPTSRSGNGARGHYLGVREYASTEPRPRGRGTASISLKARTQAALQRSPDLAVGERRDPEPERRDRHELQRSPDLAVGERGWALRWTPT